jgi:glycolate oxidase FAD binding subunit
MSTVSARSIDQIRDAVLSSNTLRVRGGGTKTALSHDATLSLTDLSGILQYDASEFTFTALAGTTLSEIARVLAERNQFLPFDPPFIDAGATLGGTVASGLSGSGRFRYGGIRDFLLGVKMVTRGGRVVFGGSQVVKNAAGFDIPKLMVGSLGRFGVLVELVFKVFPKPESFATVCFNFNELQPAIAALFELARRPLDLTCLDLEPPGRICVRIGASRDSLAARVDRIARIVQLEPEPADDDEYWPAVNGFSWLPKSHELVKVPISPAQISVAESSFELLERPIPRRYSVGGNVLWLGWPSGDSTTKLEGLCRRLGRSALAITGRWPARLIAPSPTNAFQERLEVAFTAGSLPETKPETPPSMPP